MKDKNTNSKSFKESIQSIWSVNSDEISKIVEIEEECGPTKTCKNMKEITFEGFAESGGSLSDAWKATLAREGKLNEGKGSIKDIILGSKENR